ncbi:MAG: hypothetical protein B7X53_00745 [Hyphomonas sp. 34-62-18]|nr:hypothetical protein [Hyphomonas sp. 34-62-18]OYW88428.1 MAG: hypothetical protein B7Z22_02470 [Hyphomonas sp. 32-62-5]OZB19219.1 MAG: hypothetical protein B7X53_00745 [Hyphomonas sp. 34-62-18]
MNPIDIAILVGMALGSHILSTLIIRLGIPRLKSGDIPATEGGALPESTKGRVFDLGSTGFWIGLCETLLIFILVSAQQFSALAIIIGVKQFVRSDKIQQNPSYYLLGTFCNLTIATLFALTANQIISG